MNEWIGTSAHVNLRCVQGYEKLIFGPIPRAQNLQLLKSLEKMTLVLYFFRSNHTVNFQADESCRARNQNQGIERASD
jgi:hypothetical protein